MKRNHTAWFYPTDNSNLYFPGCIYKFPGMSVLNQYTDEFPCGYKYMCLFFPPVIAGKGRGYYYFSVSLDINWPQRRNIIAGGC